MKKTLQSILAVLFLSIGISADAQTRYLDDVFTGASVSEIDTFALNISIEPMLIGLDPS